MTITLYLQKNRLLQDLLTLAQIIKSNNAEVVKIQIGYLKPIKISTKKYYDSDVSIQVTFDEFTLISIFTKGEI